MAGPVKKDTVQADKPVINRFDKLRSKEQKKIGSRPIIYRPDFLIMLMDNWERTHE
jgi:hypothetical protein